MEKIAELLLKIYSDHPLFFIIIICVVLVITTVFVFSKFSKTKEKATISVERDNMGNIIWEIHNH